MRFTATLLLLVPLVSCGEDSAPDEVMSGSGDVACQDVDSESTLGVLTRCAEQGNARAQTNLGVRYNLGEGVPEDFAEALRWYRLAAQQGDAKAQYNIGVMYANGEGFPEDFAEAIRWYRLAAKQGEVDAQFNLGLMYANGEGVPEDFAEAG